MLSYSTYSYQHNVFRLIGLVAKTDCTVFARVLSIWNVFNRHLLAPAQHICHLSPTAALIMIYSRWHFYVPGVAVSDCQNFLLPLGAAHFTGNFTACIFGVTRQARDTDCLLTWRPGVSFSECKFM